MSRLAGFHWLLSPTRGWVIGLSTPDGWLLPGSQLFHPDTAFREVGPRLERQPSTTTTTDTTP